ncbi:hypothetical protein [Derxia lacustris]|uniref:hypothetical protein n=1 Tax=Derxia lacustris TaxID=764842 RepID=UPI00111C5365|nr:hypothetical protein [Derxia lacustris]
MHLKLRINDRDVYVRSGMVLTDEEVRELAQDVVQDASSLRGAAVAIALPHDICNRLHIEGARHELHVGLVLTPTGTRILRLVFQVEEVQLCFFLHAGDSRTKALLEAMRSRFGLLASSEETRQLSWCHTTLDFKDAPAVLALIANDVELPASTVRADVLAYAAAAPAWLAPVSLIDGVDVGTSVVVIPAVNPSVATEVRQTVH